MTHDPSGSTAAVSRWVGLRFGASVGGQMHRLCRHRRGERRWRPLQSNHHWHTEHISLASSPPDNGTIRIGRQHHLGLTVALNSNTTSFPIIPASCSAASADISVPTHHLNQGKHHTTHSCYTPIRSPDAAAFIQQSSIPVSAQPEPPAVL